MVTIEGGRGAIKERMVQFEKRTMHWLAMKMSMMGVANNGAAADNGAGKDPTRNQR
jgi:hypothetical protein